nr:2-succinyl-5-enolpyruvyl-6-hydroxy-3-cyclohexene-1-carboxylic-acid synthase [Thalassobacillus pellis]
MDHTEELTRYIARFVQGLHYSGVEEVVISPGSRSTPLAMTCAEFEGIRHWVNLDERSAAFFALGIAKEQRKPVALVCTSGTAAANYFPAIVEAYYSRIPLIVLTADRPHELRDIGAPQAIEQVKLYGDYIKWFHDMALPEATPPMLRYSRNTAQRAVQEANHGNPGPVHVNIPLREPLIPDFSLKGLWVSEPKDTQTLFGKRNPDETDMSMLAKELKELGKGVLVCGPQSDRDLRDAVGELAKRLGAPVLADPLSQLRTGQSEKDHIIESYDAILKSDNIKAKLRPDYIIRFGAMPVSKAYLQWLQQMDDFYHIVVEPEAGFREPSGVFTRFLYSDSAVFAQKLANQYEDMETDGSWLGKWQKMNQTAKDLLLTESPEESVNEGQAVVKISEAIPDHSILFVGNSMPIRDVDTFFMSTPKEVEIMANRGANGIDGVVSAALGTGANGKRVTLLIGDLSLFHDFNGLWIAKEKQLNITIVLINNDGGGIFSYLPQASHPAHYEELFGTPLRLPFKPIIEAYGGDYHLAESWEAFSEQLTQSYTKPGLSVIELRTCREDNVPYHKAKWDSIKEAIEKQLEE